VITILAPIDFSAVSNAVVAQAAALARTQDGRVVLLSVIQPPPMVTEYAPALENIAEITAAGERNAARQLEKIEAKLAAAFVAAESLQLVGSAVEHIAAQADKLSAEYIVMGSHGHTALYDLLVGSTTHGVLQRAKCPVVIVPAPKKDKTKTSRQRHQAVA
jgi:nucleotide-binding universal stress UspA family protein